MTKSAEAPAKSAGQELKELVSTVVTALAIALVLRVALFQPFTIPSSSMEPGLVTGDYIIVSKFSYGWSYASFPLLPPMGEGRVLGKGPQRGDVVVFHLPSDTRKDLIKRVVSLEFNRFLKQYKDARDLNVDLASKDRNPRVGGQAREPREKSGFGRSSDGPMRSMFINIGSKDGFDKGKMLGYLCGITGLTGQNFGRILMKDMYTFIDIESAHFDEAMGHFKNANYKGRKVRVDEGGGAAGGAGGTGARDFKADKKKFNKARYAGLA